MPVQITPLCQRDPQWSRIRIGKSAATVRDFGCTLTSCCMALQKLRGTSVNPGEAAKFWSFKLKGEILWTMTKFLGMNFVWRGYIVDVAKVTKYANDPDKAVILEVNHRRHWIYLESVSKGIMTICDPIDGKRYVGLPKKYKFTGYALFEKAKK